MSLINEALKKAQRTRNSGPLDEGPPVPGGGTIARRGEARSANTMVLLGSAAVVLVVVSVAATIYLLNRPAARPADPVVLPSPKVKAGPAEAPATTIVVPAIAAPASDPVVTVPVVPAPLPAPEPTNPPVDAPAAPVIASAPSATPVPSPVGKPASHPVAAVPAPTAVQTPPITAAPPPASSPVAAAKKAPVPAAVVPPAAAPSGPPAAPMPDERIAAYVEATRIMGVRASGADSRVLINDRVYRLNDIIERTLGIRLTAVAPGSLTFTDANGFTYVKHL